MKDNKNTVQCGVCEDSVTWSRISSELLRGELVCHNCMSMEPWVFQDPYKNDMELELKHKCAMDAEISGDEWQPSYY